MPDLIAFMPKKKVLIAALEEHLALLDALFARGVGIGPFGEGAPTARLAETDHLPVATAHYLR